MTTAALTADVVIVGGGMAGASLAAELAPHCRVVLIEGEATPGYHSTGRSAAFWHETLGGPAVQPLTRASYAALDAGGYLTPRAALEVATARSLPALDAFEAEFAGIGVTLERLDHDGIRALVPRARPLLVAGLLESRGGDIDVAALHADRLATTQRAGGTILTGAPVTRIERGWRIEAGATTIDCAIVVDAAGAWADAVARLAGVPPLGIRPLRRTMVQVRVDGDDVPVDLPLVIDIAGRWYFRPQGRDRLWLCPHDETPVIPHDVVPEDIDVARAIDRFQRVTQWRVVVVERKWAGLRSFAADRLPVYGFDPQRPGFFWFGGQGGIGIQTALAAARLAAHLILGAAVSPPAGVDPDRYRPARLR